ncbi:MAG: PQQ-binding-like beta-propeller repeat protein [Pirellula sp.]
MTRWMLAACFVLFNVGLVRSENWAHWRGPTGNSVAINAQPPISWSATENVKWKAEIPGRGSGSPIVWEQQVFVVSAVPASGKNLSFRLFSFDRNSGKLNWERIAIDDTPHQGTHETNGYASASPCTDGQNVYAHFGSRGLHCYSMDGKFVWKREFGKMNTRSSFGEGSSPTLVDDMIIVPWDHEEGSKLFALNKKTGSTIWEVARDEPTCWATPLIVNHDGKKQIIMNGQRFARAYDLASGRELWRCSGQTERPCASAVASDGLAFVGSGFRGAFMGAFRLDGTGDITGSKSVVWKVDRNTPDVASPLLTQGRIYFYKGKTGQLTCLDSKTGKAHYEASRIPELNGTYASPVAAGGHIYLTDRSGTIVVIKDSSELEIVSTNPLGEGVDATPAPVDNELFIRGEKHLFCVAR